MSDTTEVGDKTKGNKAAKKAAGEGGVSINGQIGRMLVRAIWSQEWAAANPDATGETRKAAWKEARSEAMEKNLKIYRRAMASLTRSGVSITMTEDAAGSADGDDDSED